MKKLMALNIPNAETSRAPKAQRSTRVAHRGRHQLFYSHVMLIAVSALVLMGSLSSHFDNATHLLILAVTGAKSLTDAWAGG